jgi:hypothetical protein
MNNNLQNEKGLGLGVIIIAIMVILLSAPFYFGFKLGPFVEGSSTVFIGLSLQFWGILFVLSYYFSHKTFLFRGLIWFCENISRPSGRRMAFFYFFLSFLIGTIALLKGIGFFSSDVNQESSQSIPSGAIPIENWWYKDPILYVVILVIIVAGYYRYRANKKNKTKR